MVSAPLRLLVVAAALALLGAREAAAQDAFTGLEEALRAALAKSGATGAAVAIVQGERVTWTRGIGVASVETGAVVTADTLFQIGSATDAFTAAAVLAAASQGALAIDQPVSRVVSGVVSCVGQPTLAELMSHAGGLGDDRNALGPAGADGVAAYVRSWTDDYCLLPPGRAFSYSQAGFALLAAALQEADKRPYAEALRRRLLDPVGMVRTALGPAGTLHSSANEMARFAIALLNDGRVDGAQALPPGIAAQMRVARASIRTTGEASGYGLFVRGDTVGHGGAMTGSTAQVTLDPQARVGVVVLTNGDGADPAPLEALALAAARGRGLPPPAASPTIQPVTPATALASYPGTYANPRRFTVEIVEREGGLVLRRFGRDLPMHYVDPGRFVIALPNGGRETIIVGPGPNGRAAWMQMGVWTLARVR